LARFSIGKPGKTIAFFSPIFAPLFHCVKSVARRIPPKKQKKSVEC